MFAKFTNLFHHKNDDGDEVHNDQQTIVDPQTLQQQIDQTQKQLAETQRKLQEAQKQLRESENGSPNSNEEGDCSDMEQFLEERRKQRQSAGFRPTPLFQRGISGHQVLVTRNACGTMSDNANANLLRGDLSERREPFMHRRQKSELSSSSNRNLNHSDSSRSLSLNRNNMSAGLQRLLSENHNVDNSISGNADDLTHRSLRSNSSFRSQKSTTSLLGEKPDFIPRDWLVPNTNVKQAEFAAENNNNEACSSPCAPVREHNCSRETSPEVREQAASAAGNGESTTKRLVRSHSPEQDFDWRAGERIGFLQRQQSMRKPVENKFEREGKHIERSNSMRKKHIERSNSKSERDSSLNLQRTVTQGSILGEAPNSSILGGYCGHEQSKRSILGMGENNSGTEPVDNDGVVGLMSKPNSFRRQLSNPNMLERTTTQGSILGCGLVAEEKLKASKSSLILGNNNDIVSQTQTSPVQKQQQEKNMDTDNGFEKQHVERSSSRHSSSSKPLLRFRRTDTPLPQESNAIPTKGHVSLLTSPTTSGHPSLLNSSPLSGTGNVSHITSSSSILLPTAVSSNSTKHHNVQLTRTNSRSQTMIGGRMQRGTSSRSLLGSARAATNGDLTPTINMSSYSHSHSQSPMGHACGLPYANGPYTHATIHEHCESPSMQMPPGLISPQPVLGMNMNMARSVSPPGLVRNDSMQNQSGTATVEKTLSLNELLQRQTSESGRKSLKNMASGPDGSVGFRLRRTNTNLSCVSAA